MIMSMKAHTDPKNIRLMKEIAKNIKALRLAKGLTQEEMGDYGFGPRWYQRFESGRHMPTIPTLVKLAQVFKVDVSAFFL